jgi:hypothetical protein
VATLAADCANGPNTQRECVNDCEDLLAGDCSAEYTALRECADGEEVTCGPMGYPNIEACADAQTTFRDCVNN